MNANEFVKKFGLDLAKRDVVALESGFIKHDDFLEHYGFDILDDLKRLVESHDVVNQYPSLDAAKERLQYFINWLAEDESHAEYAPEIGKFKQAIADVEACKEVS